MEDQAVHSPDSGEVDADLLRLFAAYPFSTDPMYQVRVCEFVPLRVPHTRRSQARSCRDPGKRGLEREV